MAKYKKDIVNYETAKELYRFGFKLGSLSHYHMYDDTFIYDDDENHPESHKKGEIVLYDIWHKNDESKELSFEAPTFYQLQNYFFDKHDIVFTVFHDYNYNGELEFICKISNNKTKKTISFQTNYNTYYDSFCQGIIALISILNNKEL